MKSSVRLADVQKSISASFVYRVYGAIDNPGTSSFMKHLFSLCLPIAANQIS